jgi:hypothetical protein
MIPTVQCGFSPTKHQCLLNSGGILSFLKKKTECLLVHYKDQLVNVAWGNSDCLFIWIIVSNPQSTDMFNCQTIGTQ